MTLIKTVIPPEDIMGVDISHDTRTGKVNIVVTINPAKMKVLDISEKLNIPLTKVSTATQVVPMISIDGNKIEKALIFEW